MERKSVNAKQYFLAVLEAVDEVENLGERAARYMALAEGASGAGDGLPKAAAAYSRTETCALVLADLAHELSQRIEAMMIVIDEAAQVVAQLPSRKQRQLMRWIYFSGCTIREAAHLMKYTGTSKSLQKMHERALEEAQKILEKNANGG